MSAHTTAAVYACNRQDYYAELLAAGMTEDEARRHVWANEMQRFRNRDSYARDTHEPDERRGWMQRLGVRA